MVHIKMYINLFKKLVRILVFNLILDAIFYDLELHSNLDIFLNIHTYEWLKIFSLEFDHCSMDLFMPCERNITELKE